MGNYALTDGELKELLNRPITPEDWHLVSGLVTEVVELRKRDRLLSTIEDHVNRAKYLYRYRGVEAKVAGALLWLGVARTDSAAVADALPWPEELP